MKTQDVEIGLAERGMSVSEELLRSAVSQLGGASAQVELDLSLQELDPAEKERLAHIAGYVIVMAKRIRGDLLGMADTQDEPGPAPAVMQPFIPPTLGSENSNGNGHHETTAAQTRVLEPVHGPEPLDLDTTQTPTVPATEELAAEDAAAADGSSEVAAGEEPTTQEQSNLDVLLAKVPNLSENQKPAFGKLFSHPGQKFSPKDIKSSILAKSEGAAGQAFGMFIKAIRDSSLGEYLHSEGSTKNRRYWVELPDSMVLSAPEDTDHDDNDRENPGTVPAAEQDVESGVRKAQTLTEWGLAVSHPTDDTEILTLNGQPVRLRNISQDVLKTIMGAGRSLTFVELRGIMEAKGQTCDVNMLQGALHELDNFFETYGLEQQWHNRVINNEGQPDRVLRVKGMLGEAPNFLGTKPS